ncbi:protein-ADP-ribose hydrolase [Lachnospira pectinoschiza]|uniref:O-acetyl-ADP-ribose deacetylase (Regulator of RNase III), contains Macro domain n=1 Tax=Lachnospira pectinoschiza TaxID=28052 RepID=A0A1H0A3N0_9FIRM|nr:protein-ADP-ribose hydrolase [Lachnospira pectinoschiza]SDN28035.1 O-acetyl-ADP-ribose deacetylase (regulator of RNase III), contains Macro domain [Lachnospira pectinoschiza]
MTQDERLLFLIKELQNEDPYYKNYDIPKTQQEKKDFLRALMNVREAKPISEEFLKIQDGYLLTENAKNGFVSLEDLEKTKANSNIFIYQGDITRLKLDAIVNAANSAMLGCFSPLHSCIDNIIHSKAGIQLRLECNEIMEKQGFAEKTGGAKITKAYNLPAKHVIHTVGPIVQGRLTKRHEELLASCYRSCLNLARENELSSIAFCCISTGVFSFPNTRAAQIATATVMDWLKENDYDIKVVFNVFKDIDYKLYNEILN